MSEAKGGNIPTEGLPFGRYRLIAKLAVGGMAELFLAYQRGVGGFNKKVVIKCILPYLSQNKEFIDMFLAEARLAAHLNHPNVVQIYDIGDIDGIYYMAMEYIPGQNLREFTRRLYRTIGDNTSPPYGLIAAIFAQAAAGLDYVHRATDENNNPLDLIHRDISPNNLILSYQGQLKIVDFGVAKARTQEKETEVGVLKGRLSYMSPEQISGYKLDGRSDIFSLGVVMYELTTNRRLFRRKTEPETIRALLSGPIPSPKVFFPDYPPQLEEILMKMLKRDREERYQSAAEVRRDLEAFLASTGQLYGPTQLSEFMKKLFAEEIQREEAGIYPNPVTVEDLINLSRGSYRILRDLHQTSASYSLRMPSVLDPVQGHHHYPPAGSHTSEYHPQQPTPYPPPVPATQPIPGGEPLPPNRPNPQPTQSYQSYPSHQSSPSPPSAPLDEEATTVQSSSYESIDYIAESLPPPQPIESPPGKKTAPGIKSPDENAPPGPTAPEQPKDEDYPRRGEKFEESSEALPAAENNRNFFLLLSSLGIGIILASIGIFSYKAGWFSKGERGKVVREQDIPEIPLTPIKDRSEVPSGKGPGDSSTPKVGERTGENSPVPIKKVASTGTTDEKKPSQHSAAKDKTAPKDNLKKPPDKSEKVEKKAKKSSAARTKKTSSIQRNKKRKRTGKIAKKKKTRKHRGKRTHSTGKVRPFREIRLPDQVFIAVYRRDSAGRRVYTGEHRKLALRIEREVQRLLGGRYRVRGVTIPWIEYVKKKFERGRKYRYKFYPLAVAYIIYTRTLKGQSRGEIARALVKYQQRYRFKKYLVRARRLMSQ